MSQHDEQKEQEPLHGRPHLTRHTYESVIDQIMKKAQSDGIMDNLPGQGQPLKLDDDALVPEEYRLGNRMLKSSGFAPPWIEARREIEAERAELERWLKDANRRWGLLGAPARAALKVAYRRKLDDVQRLILNYNLRTPAGAPQIEGLRMVDELGKLGS